MTSARLRRQRPRAPADRRTRRRPASLSAKQREWLAGYLFVLPDCARAADLRRRADGAGAEPRLLRGQRLRRLPLRRPRQLSADVGRPAVLAVPRASRSPTSSCSCRRSTSPGSAWRCSCSGPTAFNTVMRATVLRAADGQPRRRRAGLAAAARRQDRHRQPRCVAAIGLGGISLLGDPDVRALHGRRRQRVVPDGLLHADLPRRPAGHPERILRGGARSTAPARSASFWYITLPLLRPTSFFVLLISLVAAVAGGQAFDLIYVMTKGGPANSTAAR